MATRMETNLEESYVQISNEETRECEQHFLEGGAKACEEFLRRKVEEWQKVPLDIGIIGNAKTGKSSFINAIRGLTADDEGGAQVGVIETTMKPEAYAHPNNGLLKFWDLPGLGTVTFPKERYLEMVEFHKYDFFLIMSSDTFTENDKWLAGEIASKKKNYFFVRTKVDQHIQNDQHDHPRTHDRDLVLGMIVENVKKNLGDQYHSDRVFLIDNHMPNKYDFDRLAERLLEDFPSLKREALILSMTSFSKEMVRRKVEALRKGIWRTAAVSGTVALVPVPGLSIAVDLGLILERGRFYFSQLGLDDESLRKMSRVLHCDVTRLKQIVPKEWKKWLTMYGIRELIVTFPMVTTAMAVEEGARYIPMGSFIAAPLSYLATYQILKSILAELEGLAMQVMEAAIEDGSRQAVFKPGSASGKGPLSNKVRVLSAIIWPAALLSACFSIVHVWRLSIAVDLLVVLVQSVLFFRFLGLHDTFLQQIAKGTKSDLGQLREIVSMDWKKWMVLQAIKALAMKMMVMAMVSAVGTYFIPYFSTWISVPVSFILTYSILDEIWNEMEKLAVLVKKAALGDNEFQDYELLPE